MKFSHAKGRWPVSPTRRDDFGAAVVPFTDEIVLVRAVLDDELGMCDADVRV